MGGEKFDTPHPEGYLFGENMDLNFLGNRPVQVRRRFEIGLLFKITLWFSPFYESFLYFLYSERETFRVMWQTSCLPLSNHLPIWLCKWLFIHFKDVDSLECGSLVVLVRATDVLKHVFVTLFPAYLFCICYNMKCLCCCPLWLSLPLWEPCLWSQSVRPVWTTSCSFSRD